MRNYLDLISKWVTTVAGELYHSLKEHRMNISG